MPYLTNTHVFSKEEISKLKREEIVELIEKYEKDLRVIAFHEKRGESNDYKIRIGEFYKLMSVLRDT